MMKKRLRTYIKNWLLVGASACLVIAYACKDELVVNDIPTLGNDIVCSVVNDSIKSNMGASSRASVKKSARFMTALGEDSICLQMIEEENTALFIAQKADTTESRAAALSSSTLNNFTVTAFLDDNNSYSTYMDKQEVTKSSGGWTYAPVRYWPYNKVLHFFGFAQSMGVGDKSNPTFVTPTFGVSYKNQKEYYHGSFDYELPLPSNDHEDAAKQPDLIFAITPQQTKDSNNGTVEFNFKHALSAVVFNITNVPDNNMKIKSISFKGIKSGGTCTLTGTDEGFSFDWNTDKKSEEDYTQNIETTYGPTTDVEEVSTTSSENCFMMVPHKFSDEATLEIVIKTDAYKEEITLSWKLKDISEGWEPNKKYTYTISLPDVVEVHIDDKVTGTVKSDLCITNTGLSPVYVRVAIIGNWVIEREEGNEMHYDVVADWLTTDGTFVWGMGDAPQTNATNSRNWRMGTDGFYYYMKELDPGSSIPENEKLFDSYTLTVGPPIHNAVLDMTIAVQAVQKAALIQTIDGQETYIWPKEIVDVINGNK